MSHRPPAEWLLVALISLQGASVSQAQISRWQLGGSGLQWTGNDSISILVDTTPTAIRPTYLTPDQNVFAQLDNWSPRKFPRELGFVDGQRPRAWWLGFGSESTAYNATYLVDGDSTSYLPPNTQGRHDWFTFDLAVPVPAFRFGFFTPSQGFRSDGTPLSQDVVPAYEISIRPRGRSGLARQRLLSARRSGHRRSDRSQGGNLRSVGADRSAIIAIDDGTDDAL